ncbi:cytochrome c oxidase subunit 1, partial [Tilletia horrida]
MRRFLVRLTSLALLLLFALQASAVPLPGDTGHNSTSKSDAPFFEAVHAPQRPPLPFCKAHHLNATRNIPFAPILHDYIGRKGTDGHRCEAGLAERVEWRALTPAQRQGWIDAVWCLSAMPSRLAGTETRLDGRRTSLLSDFALIHIRMFYVVHYVAAFLPWHRLFLLAHHRALRDCGYLGPMPYWDWSIDADTGNVLSSPIFSDTLGIGGNGSYPNGTVTKGPFAYLPLDYSSNPDFNASRVLDQPHYLRRTIGVRNAHNSTQRLSEQAYNSSAVHRVLTASVSNFSVFWPLLEGLPKRLDIVGAGPHSAIHEMMGGDLFYPHSPFEPMFFLHHANIDRLWWAWQNGETTARGGRGRNTRMNGTDATSNIWSYSGNTVQLSIDPLGGPPASLFDVQTLQGLIMPNMETYKLLDITRPPLCYNVLREYGIIFRNIKTSPRSSCALGPRASRVAPAPSRSFASCVVYLLPTDMDLTPVAPRHSSASASASHVCEPLPATLPVGRCARARAVLCHD